MTMDRALRSFGVLALAGLFLATPACSSDDGKGSSSGGSSSGGSSSGGSSSGKGGSSSGGSSSGKGGSSSSSGSSASYGFCLGNSGWTCPSNEAKSACVKGNCAECTSDPSQCSDDSGDNGSGDNGSGDNGSGDDF
jgi:hypothetical protein